MVSWRMSHMTWPSWSITHPESDEPKRIDIGTVLGSVAVGLVFGIVLILGVVYCCRDANKEVGNEDKPSE
jgi:hypothetical protein